MSPAWRDWSMSQTNRWLLIAVGTSCKKFCNKVSSCCFQYLKFTLASSSNGTTVYNKTLWGFSVMLWGHSKHLSRVRRTSCIEHSNACLKFIMESALPGVISLHSWLRSHCFHAPSCLISFATICPPFLINWYGIEPLHKLVSRIVKVKLSWNCMATLTKIILSFICRLWIDLVIFSKHILAKICWVAV